MKQVDIRRELDNTLKDACRLLRGSAISMVLAPLESFLAKVTAFSGVDIPLGGGIQDGAAEVLLPAGVRKDLKAQAFIKVERIHSTIAAAAELAAVKSPELRDVMQLYIDNDVSRAVLMKPIQADVEQMRRKTATVINSCVDPGQGKRDLEAQLDALAAAILAELSEKKRQQVASIN